MTPAYEYVVRNAPSLRRFAGKDPKILLAGLRGASGGERRMIAAALSLIPDAWLDFEKPPFSLADLSGVDPDNAEALARAVLIAAKS